MNYKDLTPEQREALPATLGVTREHALEDMKRCDKWNYGSVYDLDFDSVTQEMETALHIGLENYHSLAASCICELLAANQGTNKPAQLFNLYIFCVCGDYTGQEVNKAWKAYTEEQQQYITDQMVSYLNSELESIIDSFDLYEAMGVSA